MPFRQNDGPGLCEYARIYLITLPMMKIPMPHMKKATVGRANCKSATYLVSDEQEASPRQFDHSPVMPWFFLVCALFVCEPIAVKVTTRLEHDRLIQPCRHLEYESIQNKIMSPSPSTTKKDNTTYIRKIYPPRTTTSKNRRHNARIV